MDRRDEAAQDYCWYTSLNTNLMLATAEVYTELDEDDEDFGDYTEEVTIRFHWEVCSVCDGNGSHVHPGIDAHGICEDEWANEWDYDEREAYMTGFYDVSCYGCGGLRIEAVPNENDPNWMRLEKRLQDDANYAAECAAERRMGC